MHTHPESYRQGFPGTSRIAISLLFLFVLTQNECSIKLFLMSTPRKKKPSRTDQQPTTKYSYILGNQLHLVTRTPPATQETSNTQTDLPPAGGRRSTDKSTFELFLLWDSLSRREQDVTVLACRGFTDRQIALWLKLSIPTVKSYLQHVYLKVDVHNRRELMLKFMHFDFDREVPHK
jgi:DNA-binding CsgD family transcriptional regulator